MTWPLPRPNPPPCCCPRPLKFPPPFVEGIVVVEDTDSVGIAVEGIEVVDIVQADTKDALIQLAYAHRFH